MTVQSLLRDLTARGVVLTANSYRLDIDAPDDVLTDELLATLRDHKDELLELLRPVVVRGDWIGECLWDNCDGALIARRWGRGWSLIQCKKCGLYFELLPPLDMGVCLDDLAIRNGAQWVM